MSYGSIFVVGEKENEKEVWEELSYEIFTSHYCIPSWEQQLEGIEFCFRNFDPTINKTDKGFIISFKTENYLNAVATHMSKIRDLTEMLTEHPDRINGSALYQIERIVNSRTYIYEGGINRFEYMLEEWYQRAKRDGLDEIQILITDMLRYHF